MPKNIKTQKVIRNFTNYFAQNVYELEDGTTIYIDYSNDIVNIETPMKEEK